MSTGASARWVVWVAIGAAVLLFWLLRVLAPDHEVFDRRGYPDCAPAAAVDVLANDSLECWMFSPGVKPWRITSALSAHYVFVIRVEAYDRGVAGHVAQLVVDQHAEEASEIVVYVRHVDAASDPHVTRMRWTPDHGFEPFEFPLP